MQHKSHLDHKVGHNPPIVGVHPGPVGVEDPGDSDLDTRLLVVGVGQGLRHPLALIVAGPGADGVHVAPVGLGLRVNLGISVNLIGYVYELNIVIKKTLTNLPR